MNTSTVSVKPQSFRRVLRQVLPGLVILPCVALLLSAVMTWANVGLGEEFLPRWARSFITSLVVLPLILASLSVIDRWMNTVLASLHWVGRKLVVSLLTAVAIESVLALVVTAINSPWDSTFGLSWWITLAGPSPSVS